MTEANKFLDKKGYEDFNREEMISLPKIQMQSIMQEYLEEKQRNLLIGFAAWYGENTQDDDDENTVDWYLRVKDDWEQ